VVHPVLKLLVSYLAAGFFLTISLVGLLLPYWLRKKPANRCVSKLLDRVLESRRLQNYVDSGIFAINSRIVALIAFIAFSLVLRIVLN
jgi:hypothetical protein